MTDEELTQQFQELKSYVLDLRTAMIQRFDDIDQRLDTLIGTVNSMDVRLPVLTRAITAMESRAYRQSDIDGSRDARIAGLEERIRRLEGAA